MSTVIEKLDGPKGDPILDAQCNIIGTYEGSVIGGALADGDWARWTADDGTVSEHRWFAPAPPAPPKPRALTKLEFIGLVQAAGGMTDAQLVAAHDDASLRPLWIKFDHAPDTIEKTHPLVAPGLAALAGLGYIPNGAQAVLDAWSTT